MNKETKIGISAALLCAILLGFGIWRHEIGQWMNHTEGHANVPAVSLDGDWKQSNGNAMQAHISHGEIQITYVNSTAFNVYWQGSWSPKPSFGGNKFYIHSANDHPAGEIFSSKSDEKIFTYDHGVLSFVFTALGEEHTIEMTKGA